MLRFLSDGLVLSVKKTFQNESFWNNINQTNILYGLDLTNKFLMLQFLPYVVTLWIHINFYSKLLKSYCLSNTVFKKNAQIFELFQFVYNFLLFWKENLFWLWYQVACHVTRYAEMKVWQCIFLFLKQKKRVYNLLDLKKHFPAYINPAKIWILNFVDMLWL